MCGKNITVDTEKLSLQIEQLQQARDAIDSTLHFNYTQASDCSGLVYNELVKLQDGSKDVVSSLEKLYDSTISFLNTINTSFDQVDSGLAGEGGEG